MPSSVEGYVHASLVAEVVEVARRSEGRAVSLRFCREEKRQETIGNNT